MKIEFAGDEKKYVGKLTPQDGGWRRKRRTT
jgi:hypothetical protein